MDRGPYSRHRAFVDYTRSKRRRWRRGRHSLFGMNLCRRCDGAVVKCMVCGHVHCDEDCRPISCIEKEQRDDQERVGSQ